MTALLENEAALRRIGATEDAHIMVAEAALILAAMDRPGAQLATYREHLDNIASEMAVAARMPDVDASEERGLDARCQILQEVMAANFGYQGDRLTYDDLQNANLMRVIDRRKGLPVALSILYIHAARSQGWQVEGVNFPGHFVIRLYHDGRAAILDPFEGGQRIGIGDLRRRLKSVIGDKAELNPSHYAAISNRDVLIRLENNIKLRLIQEGDLARAVRVVERMLMMAPRHATLWRECGLMHARIGNLLAARAALGKFLDNAENTTQRQQAARLLLEIGQQLH